MRRITYDPPSRRIAIVCDNVASHFSRPICKLACNPIYSIHLVAAFFTSYSQLAVDDRQRPALLQDPDSRLQPEKRTGQGSLCLSHRSTPIGFSGNAPCATSSASTPDCPHSAVYPPSQVLELSSKKLLPVNLRYIYLSMSSVFTVLCCS